MSEDLDAEDEAAPPELPPRRFEFEIPDGALFAATAAFGPLGRRIIRMLPMGREVTYVDARDMQHLQSVERWQWLIVSFWAQVAQAVLLTMLRELVTEIEQKRGYAL